MDYRKLGLFVLFWLILAQTLSFERIAIGTLICVAVYLFNKDLQSFNQKNRNLALPNLNTKLKNEFNKTVLANSITLTPGTLTLDSTNDKLIIHCLDKEVAKGLENSKFEQMLLKKEELFND
ncbi:MAG: sodium:proton antiporter [Bacillota bacterium]|nr:sodium:proton antiporter [Bacillota bacterium]